MPADTYSTDGVGLLLMGTGNDNNTWGANANTGDFQITADAIAGILTSAVTGGTLDLSGTPPPAASSQARYWMLKFTGVLGSTQIVQVPNLSKSWIVNNQTTGAFTLTFKTPAGSASSAIPQGGWGYVWCDGANVINVSPYFSNQLTLPGVLLSPNGSASAPAYSFTSDATMGMYRVSAGHLGFSLNGLVLDLSSGAAAITGTLAVSGTSTLAAATFSGTAALNAGGTITGTFGGTPTFSGAVTLSSTLAVAGKASFTSTDSLAVAKGTTAQRNGSPSVGDVRYNSTLNGLEWWNGTAWIVQGQALTVQRFTSGTGATYTPTAGVVRVRVRTVGAGGAGGDTGNSGGAGGTTSFGSWTALGGAGGASGSGTSALGGGNPTPGVDGTGTLILRATGASGNCGQSNFTGFSGASNVTGPVGASGPFGGAGPNNTAAQATRNAQAPGSGGGGTNPSQNTQTASGAAGEYVEFWVNNPAPITYTVGVGGVRGSSSGGNGFAGIIIVEEFYA